MSFENKQTPPTTTTLTASVQTPKEAANEWQQAPEPHHLTIQTKLTVGAADDPYEREADAIADQVMRVPLAGTLQRQCAHCEEEQVQKQPLSTTSFLQRKTSGTPTVSPQLDQKIQASRGNGVPLENGTRSFMASRMGADFSQVRIHTGSEAIQMSRELHAKAFTVGSDIYFNEGAYAPQSDDGKHLIAHELTHTLQQGQSNTAVQRTPTVLPEVNIVGDPQFYHRALRSNRYYEQHIHIAGWPYLEQLRALWAAHSYDDFADAVREFQETVMHMPEGDGILGPTTASAMSVPGVGIATPPPPSPATVITREGLATHADWVERRILGVGIFGWGGPFRLDLEVNAQGYPTRSIFIPRSLVSILSDPLASGMEFQLGNRIYGSLTEAQQAVRDFPFAMEGATVYGFYRGEENIIFPTIISDTTTPHLMRALRLAIRNEQDDARAASSLLIQSFLLAAGLRAPLTTASSPESAAPTVAREAVAAGGSSAVTTLRNFFAGLLRSRSAGSITVEGVQFGNVRAAMEGSGTVLRVTRTTIENVGRVPGQGRAMAEAFEQAAVALGRSEGATTVRVSVETVVNRTWLAQLEAMGYRMEQIERFNEAGRWIGMSNVWTKVFNL